MSRAERARFYLGIAVLLAFAGCVFALAWALISAWTMGALPANGGWLISIILLACSAMVGYRSYCHTRADELARARLRERWQEYGGEGADRAED